MNAKFRRSLDRLLADVQSGTSGSVWPETVERRIGLDVQDGMMGVVIDGEVVDASSDTQSDECSRERSSSTFMGAADAVVNHRPRRLRPRRLRLGRLAYARRIHRIR